MSNSAAELDPPALTRVRTSARVAAAAHLPTLWRRGDMLRGSQCLAAMLCDVLGAVTAELGTDDIERVFHLAYTAVLLEIAKSPVRLHTSEVEAFTRYSEAAARVFDPYDSGWHGDTFDPCKAAFVVRVQDHVGELVLQGRAKAEDSAPVALASTPPAFTLQEQFSALMDRLNAGGSGLSKAQRARQIGVHRGTIDNFMKGKPIHLFNKKKIEAYVKRHSA